MNPRTFKLIAPLLVATSLMIQPAAAVILFGLDNSANLTDPSTGVPFDSIAKVYNNSGDGATRGSAIYLGSGYMLTANHVAVSSDQSFTFNGVDSYTLDLGFTPIQVAAGVDLKVFRLDTTPTVAAVSLRDGSTLVAPATMVGWGLGRKPTVPIDSATVTWGDLTTIAKRWGLNTPRDSGTVTYVVGPDSYSYTALRTVLGSSTGSPTGLGASEAAATRYDSGSGLFQYLDGAWQLIGVTAAVEGDGTSFFGDDAVSGAGKGDGNYFASVSAYRSDILALIPEPTTSILLSGTMLLILKRRRKRSD